MDAKELRIDNWVSYENKNFKIHSVSPELPCLDTIEFGIGVVTYENIYPIELTDDILTKCGFVKGIDNCFFIDCFFYDLISTSFCWDDESITHFDSIDIKYLHQLQNLYYCLTGKELEITL